jgi:hypothetical protein
VDHLSLVAGVLHERSRAASPLPGHLHMMEIIERAGMVDSKPCATPVDTSSKLFGDTGNPVSDPTHYHSLYDALQYLMWFSRFVSTCMIRESHT